MDSHDAGRSGDGRSARRLELAGRLLAGRYRLESLLGRGAAAEVYRAFDVVLERAIAVKLFNPGAEMAAAVRRNSEIRVLAGLNHPGLVTLFDAGTDPELDDRPYLVMELVEGVSLAERLRDGAVAPREAALIGASLADALSYVHGQGVVHRDIKPANVLLADHTVKLGDFGIARLLDDARLTTTGSTVGTANYLSPEQARGDQVGPASDVYSLGLVVLESLTGVVAYPGHGIAAAAARLHRPPVIPAELGSAWGELLTRMTAAEPAARPTAAEAGVALRALALGVEPPVEGRTRVIGATRRLPTTHRRRYLLALVAAVIIAGAVTLAYALSSPSTNGHPVSGPRPTGTSKPQTSSTPPPRTTGSIAPRPRTAAGAINEVRAAVARAVNTGNLDLSAASDLDHRLADLAHGLSDAGAKPRDLGHKVADLLKHVDDLGTKGQLTAAGRRMLSRPLTILEQFIPAQR